MKLSVCLVLLVTVWQAAAQAPGDEDARCVRQRGDVYPPNVTMLMDSRNYENLISRSNPHWQALDVDGTGTGWGSAFGGLCQSEPESCDFRETAEQENWFFTQYISYLDAREVFVNVSAYFESCRLIPTCSRLYIDMYRYERNGHDRVAARTTRNYGQPIRRIQPNGLGQAVNQISFPFIPSGNFNGFYIGVRATGTCASIRRLQVYFNSFQPTAPSPVICPKTGLPPQGSMIQVTCSCPANSRTSSNLRLTCSSDGTCTGSPSCQCLEGYRQLPQQCEACPVGTYRSSSDPAVSCLPCPANTTTSGVAVASCPCIAGHFRSAEDGPEVACSQPPTAVRHLKVTVTTSNSITIEWERPLRIGRPDFYYLVEHSDPDDISRYIRHSNDNITATSYIVDGLRPNTSYIIRVSVHNSVSDEDRSNADERIVEINNHTREGRPDPPSIVEGLCNVVLWGQPLRANGRIIRYEVQFYLAPVWFGSVISKSVQPVYHRVQDGDIRSNLRRSEVSVRVRAVTGAGEGEWRNVSLGCGEDDPVPEVPVQEVCPPAPVVICPVQPPVTPPSPPAQIASVDVYYDANRRTKLVIWNKPEEEVASYSIRVSYYDSAFRRDFRTSQNPWIQLLLTDLPSQRPLWIEVRARNSRGSAPWSRAAELCADEEG